MDTTQTCCSNHNTVVKQVFPILFPFISLYYRTSRTFIVVNQNIPCEKTEGSENSVARFAQSWLCQIKIKGAHLPLANFGLGRKGQLVLKLAFLSFFFACFLFCSCFNKKFTYHEIIFQEQTFNDSPSSLIVETTISYVC